MARMSDARAFEIIGLPMTATEREVQRSYRTLALTRHPDRGGTAAAMAELNEAHEIALEVAHNRLGGEPPTCGCDDESPSLACQAEGMWHKTGACRECGGKQKVKVTRGFNTVELACPRCAVEG